MGVPREKYKWGCVASCTDTSLLCFWHRGGFAWEGREPSFTPLSFLVPLLCCESSFGLRHCNDFTKPFAMPANSRYEQFTCRLVIGTLSRWNPTHSI